MALTVYPDSRIPASASRRRWAARSESGVSCRRRESPSRWLRPTCDSTQAVLLLLPWLRRIDSSFLVLRKWAGSSWRTRRSADRPPRTWVSSHARTTRCSHLQWAPRVRPPSRRWSERMRRLTTFGMLLRLTHYRFLRFRNRRQSTRLRNRSKRGHSRSSNCYWNLTQTSFVCSKVRTRCCWGNSVDRPRHVMTSLRELLTHTLHRLAPDREVQGWSSDSEYYNDGRPTRHALSIHLSVSE